MIDDQTVATDMSCHSSESWLQGNGNKPFGTEDSLHLKQSRWCWSEHWLPVSGWLSELTVWVSWAIQQIPAGCLLYIWWDGEGGSEGRGCMYTYGWFMLRFDRKHQNSVKQLSFNKIKFKNEQELTVLLLHVAPPSAHKSSRCWLLVGGVALWTGACLHCLLPGCWPPK